MKCYGGKVQQGVTGGQMTQWVLSTITSHIEGSILDAGDAIENKTRFFWHTTLGFCPQLKTDFSP